jgi:hypothetical protein
VVIPVNGLAVGSVARGSYLKEGLRSICGIGRFAAAADYCSSWGPCFIGCYAFLGFQLPAPGVDISVGLGLQ